MTFSLRDSLSLNKDNISVFWQPIFQWGGKPGNGIDLKRYRFKKELMTSLDLNGNAKTTPAMKNDHVVSNP